MSDISMCQNVTCPQKRECYRYMAIPEKVQSYCLFIPRDGECDGFYPIEKEHKLNEKTIFNE